MHSGSEIESLSSRSSRYSSSGNGFGRCFDIADALVVPFIGAWIPFLCRSFGSATFDIVGLNNPNILAALLSASGTSRGNRTCFALLCSHGISSIPCASPTLSFIEFNSSIWVCGICLSAFPVPFCVHSGPVSCVCPGSSYLFDAHIRSSK